MAGPTDQEQLMLELINEARINPMANAARYISSYAPLTSTDADIQNAIDFFGVDGAALLAAYSALVPVGPLAWNDALGRAAEKHSAAMINSQMQTHQAPGEAGLGPRVLAEGYNYSFVGENIFAYTESVLQGHAAFMIDWGNGPNGMQSPPGHRNNIMNAGFTEIGIDVTAENTSANPLGPLVVTQDLGTRGKLFVLGVAYTDSDHNAFYSLGEGRSDLTINVGGNSTTTTSSGGYSLETTTGAVTVQLTGGGLSGIVTVQTTIGTENIKLDVVDGSTLLTSGSVTVAGPISRLQAASAKGLSLTTGAGAQTLVGNIGADTLDGGAGNDTLYGGLGDDQLFGGTGSDLLYSGVGNDSLYGGDDNDGFYFGATMTGADEVDGGAGTLDQIGLQGNYLGGNALTLGANGAVGVEMMILLPGSNTAFGDTSGAFYSYDVTTVDANVGAGQTFVVNANTLRAGENLTFNGAAELDGTFLTYGGLGNDHLTGGQKVDGFFFGDGGRFGSGDTVDGQGQGVGQLDQLGLQGNYSGANAIAFGASQITNIEMIVLLSGTDTRFGGTGSNYSFDITMNDGNVASGQKMIINANTLVVAESVTFNGGAESNGYFQIFGGNGNDSYIGSQGNDDIWGGGGADTITGGLGADTLHGGAGDDIFRYTSTAHSTAVSMDSILDFATGDKVDVSAIDAIAGGADDAFSFVGAAAFTGTGTAELQAVNTGGNNWTVSADVDGNGSAELVIAMTVTDAHSLTAADFVL